VGAPQRGRSRVAYTDLEVKRKPGIAVMGIKILVAGLPVWRGCDTTQWPHGYRGLHAIFGGHAGNVKSAGHFVKGKRKPGNILLGINTAEAGLPVLAWLSPRMWPHSSIGLQHVHGGHGATLNPPGILSREEARQPIAGASGAFWPGFPFGVAVTPRSGRTPALGFTPLLAATGATESRSRQFVKRRSGASASSFPFPFAV
jgi:hypothetical protein